MSSGQWFMFWLLFLTFSQWIIYAKVREWWRSRHPEPKQGKPVDRVLWHLISDYETPWDAGTSWERVGRGYIVALERQGLYELLDEHDVSDHKPAYTLGYCVREEADRKEIDRLTKQLQRREEALQRKQGEIDSLRQKLAQRPAAAPTPQRRPLSADPLQAAWEEWGGCGDSLETIMQRKGWRRITAAEPEQPQAVTETAEPAPDYSTLTGNERKAKMTALKDEGLSYSEIGRLFGVSSGCVKSVVSQWRKNNKVVSVNFKEGLNGVCGGV